MSADKRCATCGMWRQKSKAGGDCMRFPPISSGAARPFVKAEDWCGEHERRKAPSSFNPRALAGDLDLHLKSTPPSRF